MLRLTLALALITISAAANDAPHWRYAGENGPDDWLKDFKDCGGKSQSPIDVNPFFSIAAAFEPFYFSYYHMLANEAHLTNNGHSLEVKLDMDNTPVLAGGNLGGNYSFAQYHLHWGADDLRGSEHTVNHVRYPMELHLVHHKSDYGTVSDSLGHPDGLAVLGVLFVISERDNPALAPLIAQMKTKREVGEDVVTTDLYPLTSLLPRDLSRFYRYRGSLTTPPCAEVVTWTLFDETVPVSEKQMSTIRSLVDSEGLPLVNNFREPQPLNGRQVFRSFKK